MVAPYQHDDILECDPADRLIEAERVHQRGTGPSDDSVRYKSQFLIDAEGRQNVREQTITLKGTVLLLFNEQSKHQRKTSVYEGQQLVGQSTHFVIPGTFNSIQYLKGDRVDSLLAAQIGGSDDTTWLITEYQGSVIRNVIGRGREGDANSYHAA